MKLLKKTDISQSGRMILLYSETGIGKTTTILQSAPGPLLYIQGEPRSLAPSLEAANRPDLDIDIAPYESIHDLFTFLASSDSCKRHKSIALDGLSFLMNISLVTEISGEGFDARSVKDKIDKPLASQVKLTMEGRGVVNAWIFRLLNLLMKQARDGKIVIITTLIVENPKWDRALSAAPALGGKEVPTNIPGFFDLIGKLEPNVDGHDNIIYPPIVRFESKDDAFLCKFTGVGKRRVGPLNLEKLLKVKGGGK